ncbi:hypothetical protein B9Z55_003198 [Caenorhabditis nigoni]|nr:hypothetical protein B9Z55_003198 [Caenorhabditis nigoni]
MNMNGGSEEFAKFFKEKCASLEPEKCLEVQDKLREDCVHATREISCSNQVAKAIEKYCKDEYYSVACPNRPTTTTEATTMTSTNSNKMIAFIIGGVVGVIVVIAIGVGVFCYCKKEKSAGKGPSMTGSTNGGTTVTGTTTKTGTKTNTGTTKTGTTTAASTARY